MSIAASPARDDEAVDSITSSTTTRTTRTATTHPDSTPSNPRPGLRARGTRATASVAVLALALTACSSAAATQTDDGATVFRYQGATGTVSYPELAEDLGFFETVELEWTGDVTGGPASIQATVTGETEFGSAFNGAVAKLQATGAQVTSVISSYGEDDKTFAGYYTLEGSPITEARDLIGKKVGLNTLGAQYETVLRSWLEQEGLTPDEVAQIELVVVPPVNLEQSLREGQIDVAALAGVIKEKAVDRGGLATLVDDTELYGSFAYGTYIVRDDLVAENPEAVEDFVQGTARAVRWAQLTPVEDVRDRLATIITERDRGETTDLVPYWRSAGISEPGGVIAEEEIAVWVDFLEKDGQVEAGELEVAELYTNEFNPYANGTYAPDAGPDGEEVTS